MFFREDLMEDVLFNIWAVGSIVVLSLTIWLFEPEDGLELLGCMVTALIWPAPFSIFILVLIIFYGKRFVTEQR